MTLFEASSTESVVRTAQPDLDARLIQPSLAAEIAQPDLEGHAEAEE